jgi:hypothetical protein
MLPVPRPATVVEVVTVIVVDPPEASVAEPAPLDAKTAEEIWGTPENASVAVRDAPLTFVTRKTLVKVRADGTVPKSRESASTFPLATGVDVPGWTAVPADTEK